jgi:hypothetical protein
METIEVVSDLVIEIHDGEPPVIWLRSESLALEDDFPGAVLVYPNEIGKLCGALAEAAGVAASMVADEHGKATII